MGDVEQRTAQIERSSGGVADAPFVETLVEEAAVEAVTIHVVGSADRAAVMEVAASIQALIADGSRHVVVDVSGAYDVDAQLLTLLARTRVTLAQEVGDHAEPGSLTILGVVLPQFLPAFEVAGLDEVFVIYDAVRRATPARHAVVRQPGTSPREGWIPREIAPHRGRHRAPAEVGAVIAGA